MQFRPQGIRVIAAGAATILNQGTGFCLVNPPAVLANHTITFPGGPADRDILQIAGGGAIVGAAPVVTTFAVLAGGTATILGAMPATLNAGELYTWQYCRFTDCWYRKV